MHLSLRTKIYGGFAIIIGMLCCNGLIAYFSLDRQAEDLAKAQAVADLTRNIAELDRDVQKLRLRVDQFVASGRESILDEVSLLHEQIVQEVQQLKETENATLLHRVSEISKFLDSHQQQFEYVVQERKNRQNSVEHVLPSKADAAVKQMQAWDRDLLEQQADADARVMIAAAIASFSEAEKEILRYFESPDSENVANAISMLVSAVDQVTAIQRNPERSNQIVLAIRDYQVSALRAVQETRSYLFFRNVVMAADIAEISYQSEKLLESATASQDELNEQINQRSIRVNQVNTATVILAILLSMAIAGQLAVSIVPPISALTHTFQQLCQGAVLEEIPGTMRKDEIGKMAIAARSFSNQNQKTMHLLEEANQLGDALQEKAEQLEATNRDLDSFAYVASHDLKSPLRGIRQLSEWIAEDMGDALSSEGSEYLNHLHARISKMEGLLEDLLEFSRVGRVNPPAESVDVNRVLENVIELTDNPKGVQIQAAGEMPIFTCIRPPLEQIFLNLIGNAVKHHDQDENARIDIECQENGEYFRFIVRDNGPGIDPVNHDRVFEMYQRVGNPDVEGSGMGLAIVKKQVEFLGGVIQLASELGEGAEFSFTCPKEPIHSSNLQPA